MRFAWLCLFISAPAIADWKPAPVPISTRWAKEVTPGRVLPEYPRPELVRKDWTNLNGLWDYAITAKDAAKPDKWDGQILVPFCIESSLSGVGKHPDEKQALWYHRTFKAPARNEAGRLHLNFGAVDWHCKVFVNDKLVGEHKGGYDPFTFDITQALKPDGDQDLVVWVWDPTETGSQPVGKQLTRPNGIWYTPVTGIWQTVWMEVVPFWGVKAVHLTPNLDRGEVEVLVDVLDRSKPARAIVKIEDVGETTIPTGVKTSIKVTSPHPWSPDDPHLYDVSVRLVHEYGNPPMREFGESVSTYFAMRKISTGKDEHGIMRLMLNNKPIFMLGPLDQGWWPDGLYTAPTDEALAYDLKVLKVLGMNMLRKHIKVEPSRLYYHCDKLGLMIWQDMPAVINRTKKHFVQPNQKDAVFDADEKDIYNRELKAMIDHLSFFPSIVGWVPFNEGWGQHDTNEVLNWVMKYDPTRLVDGPSGWADRGVGHMKDAHIYPGPGMFPVMPDRVSVLGEFGGLGLPLKGHLWKDTNNWGYRTYKNTDELRENYHRLMVQLRPLVGKGLSAAVYTQTSDVEVEVNGLMTYDREVLKLDPKETTKWHKALYGPPPTERTLIETSEATGQKWRYTTTKPADGWEKPDFDAATWKEGDGGFGTAMTPGSHVRTEWNTADIWIRREADLKAEPTGDVMLRIHHDEDAEVYINGVLAGKTAGYITEYTTLPLTPEGRKALKVGKNVIAVHCHQTTGGQYIDVGVVELVESK
jgi:hypothetical protein